MVTLHAVGFDLDGTLFDHQGSAEAGVDAFFLSLGIDPSSGARQAWFEAEKTHFERWRTGQISFQDQRRKRLRTVLPLLGMKPPEPDAQLDELFDVYLRAYQEEWRAFPDSLELLRALRASRYRVGLLSNGAEKQQLDKLRRTGLADEFDVVCTSEAIGVQKPDPAAFLVLAQGLGVRVSECLFVGDNAAHDVAGARAAGMRGLLVDRYETHSEGITEAVLSELVSSSKTAR
ncbi:HAD family hydrolase [Nesterenkonia sp. E16_7]|uniref:HAD family hydrolase n=1 Tax=unclassified Nesterenkonia TaxID=2629769 RepID=UPI001A919D84|nr:MULTISPECIES: HAD family hydrolase [unclassified Nesterenkonia]MBO0596781.1 HAD family hydrolase [Nesterenkonia sp. E16_10]MBO0600023.1 HAD family hydrolase [Nesterenkonia sp. E16_7]